MRHDTGVSPGPLGTTRWAAPASVLAVGLLVAHSDHGAVAVRRTAAVMGTELTATVLAPSRAAGFRAIEAAFSAVRRADDLLTTWRADGALARLNHQTPGRARRVPPGLFDVLSESRRWSAATGGAFDPGVGPFVTAWDLRGEGRVPDARELGAARRAAGIDRFTFDARGRVTRPDSRSWLDSGAFGKGAALRAAGRALRERGVTNALLNFGGQVVALGSPGGNEPWLVGVADPSDRGRTVATLALHDLSAATSSQSERFVTVRGRRYGHVLDPRSGQPVPAWGSVTVVAADPLVADILSTALFVMGAERGLRWADSSASGIGVLMLVDHDGRLDCRTNARMRSLIQGAQTKDAQKTSCCILAAGPAAGPRRGGGPAIRLGARGAAGSTGPGAHPGDRAAQARRGAGAGC